MIALCLAIDLVYFIDLYTVISRFILGYVESFWLVLGYITTFAIG